VRYTFLIIEEINRGNCAQIFDDLFQLLDRNDDTGRSDYPISPDEDIQKFLLTDKKYGFAALTDEQKAPIPEEVLNGELMILPPNLHIWATMISKVNSQNWGIRIEKTEE